MRAARIHKYGQPLVLEEIPTPRPGRGQKLREVIALAESGQLTSIPIEVAPLDPINDVYARLKRGEVTGRAVIEPAA
jgi:D-arabinose 1-dehydrogenase-like Zn-dependent alcohol dehydrogenase